MRMIVICGSAALSAALIAAPASAQSTALVAANLLGQEVPNGEGDDKAVVEAAVDSVIDALSKAAA